MLDDVRSWLSRFIRTMSGDDLDLLTLGRAHPPVPGDVHDAPPRLDSPVPGGQDDHPRAPRAAVRAPRADGVAVLARPLTRMLERASAQSSSRGRPIPGPQKGGRGRAAGRSELRVQARRHQARPRAHEGRVERLRDADIRPGGDGRQQPPAARGHPAAVHPRAAAPGPRRPRGGLRLGDVDGQPAPSAPGWAGGRTRSATTSGDSPATTSMASRAAAGSGGCR